jgi:hypothetical protein
MMPAMFCIPDRRPRVVARAEFEVILLVAHAGTSTAGVKVYDGCQSSLYSHGRWNGATYTERQQECEEISDSDLVDEIDGAQADIPDH